MNAYRWTVRVALGGVTLLVLWGVFVAVARIFDLVIAGVYPEACVLTAMMTAPFTIGTVAVLVIGTALVEKVLRHRRSARCLISGLHFLLGHRAAMGGSIEPPIVSRFWVMSGTTGTAAAPWFQLVVPKTVGKS